MTKPRIYVDMDGVLCDFKQGVRLAQLKNRDQPFPQSRWGFFLELQPIAGAIEAYQKLEDKYDVWILTRPSFKNINCYSEKAKWVQDHLGDRVLAKTILIPDKSLVKGDYLIDDQGGFGQETFEGEWIHFGTSKFPNWQSVIDYLI
jgi:5'(3')-deoxyribonucleotidase